MSWVGWTFYPIQESLFQKSRSLPVLFDILVHHPIPISQRECPATMVCENLPQIINIFTGLVVQRGLAVNKETAYLPRQ